MRISIITVAYNSGATIADTLRSVAAQTHADIEHVVIDGGSSDDTVAQVRAVGRHVAHLISEPDRGIYDAMNKGLKLATGEFVGFLNADDLLAAPDAIARIAAAAEGADAVYGDLVYVQATDTERIVRRWRSGSFRPERLKYGWMPPHPTFYVRRSVVKQAEFDLRYRIAADYDFMLRCLLKPGLRVRYAPEILVRMRTGGASNRSLRALLRKSREDLGVMRRHGLGGWASLAMKNLRKLPQFLTR